MMVDRTHNDLLASFNMCLWVSCAVLSVVGLTMRANPEMPVSQEPPVQQLVLDVAMSQQPLADAESEAASEMERSVASSAPQESEVVEPPPLLPVAADLQTELPSLPEMPVIKPPAGVTAETHEVAKSAAPEPEPRSLPKKTRAESARAASSRAESGAAAGGAKGSRGAVTTLTLGQGLGSKPAPIYPLRARRALQQGTVIVEFLVAENGDVSSAWLERPCSWPILNEAAVETIRRRWHFEPGAVRRYRIPIVFTLE